MRKVAWPANDVVIPWAVDSVTAYATKAWDGGCFQCQNGSLNDGEHVQSMHVIDRYRRTDQFTTCFDDEYSGSDRRFRRQLVMTNSYQVLCSNLPTCGGRLCHNYYRP